MQDGATAVLNDAAGGNDKAWEALRDCVEADVCTAHEAQDVADAIGVTEPAASVGDSD